MKGKTVCLLLPTQVQQTTANLKSVVGAGLFGGHALPAPAPWWSPGTISGGSAQCTVMKRERGIWGHPSPSWVGSRTWCKTQLIVPLTAACAFTESVSKVSATVHSAGNRNTASVCLSPELSTLLPSVLSNTKKASVWEWHPVLSASDPLALAFATETLHIVCADLPYTLIWCSLALTLHLGWFRDVKLLGERWREWALFFLLKINSSACGGGGAHL